MATESKNLVDRLKDLTICGICADTLTDARVLPCLHTFCLQCLQLAGLDRRPYSRMPCPLCRNEFTIPRQGFSFLPKNFLIENLLEMASLPCPTEVEETTATDSSMRCDLCLDALSTEVTATPPAAIVYCVDCRLSLCCLCYSHHKRLTANRNHRLSDDANVVEMFRQEVAKQVVAVTVWMAEGETKKQELMEKKAKYLQQATKAEEDIGNMRDEAMRIINSRATSLLHELAAEKERHLAKYQNDLDQLEGHLAILESFMKRCAYTKDTETGEHVSRIVEDLKGTAEDLHQIHESHLAKQVVAIEVSIQTTDLDELLNRKKKKVPTATLR